MAVDKLSKIMCIATSRRETSRALRLLNESKHLHKWLESKQFS